MHRSFVAAAALVFCAAASGQSYPSKPVRFVIPFAAGGAVDSVGRLVSVRLADAWRNPVIVENRPGAGGIIAADMVAKSPPDGYTLLMASVSLAVTPSMYRKLPFDAIRDLVPVTQVTSSSLVLVGTTKQAAGSLQELVALGRQKPGAINYGSTGVGTAGHLAVEMVNLASGAGMVHVPYMAPSSGVLSHVQGGRLRALAVTGQKRLALLPDVPTLPEAGLAGLDLSSWIGMFAPAGVPGEALSRFQGEMAKVLNSQEIRTRFAEWGFEPVGSTPHEFAQRYLADHALYARVVKEARLPLQD
jgi:tripartite-type tricarboxylate transporter receptor subunit TctC